MSTSPTGPRERDRRSLEAEIETLRDRLDEAEYALRAIAAGRVDAFVIEHAGNEHQVMMLEDARRADRIPIDRLKQGAVILSSTEEVLHVNDAFCALLGVRAEDLIGRPIGELLSEPDRAALHDLLVNRTDGPLAAIAFDRPGGPLHVRAACIPLAESNGFCLIVTGRQEPDVDEAASTVRAIRRGEVDAFVVAEDEDEEKVLLLGSAGRRYRLIVENMRDGAVTLSPDGDILYSNASFATMLGVTPPELLGHRLVDLVDAAERPLLDALTDGRRGTDTQAEVGLHRADGGSFRALLTPLRAPDQYGISLLVTDLTRQHRLAEAEATLRAIASGEVDAFVVARDYGNEIRTLTGAHRPYRMMVERMQQGAVTLSSGGEILYTNEPFAAMLGHSIGSLIGRPLAELVAPEDRALVAALIEARQGTATQGELALLRKDGGRIAALAAVALLPEEGGVCLIVTDLTPQRAYEAMVEAQALERSILEQAVDAIVLCDLDGRVIRASRAAMELCGCNPMLLPFRASFVLSSEESGQPDLEVVMRGAPIRAKEYRLVRPNAPDATVLLSAGPVVDADGRPRGAVITMTDITERRAAEDRLRESDRHKDEFLAILAHELRNPLAPIRTAVELLRTADLSEHRHASYAVDIIARQSGNLIRLVDDLLDINRINQGKIVLQLALCDMRDVVEQAVETCRPLIASRHHELDVELPEDPVSVRGDTVRLTQVVVNLLTNAANYTPPRGHIRVSLETTDAERPDAVVTVSDNGIGIPPEMVDRIFEPYEQASQSKDRATGGLGLGLTVSRRLMEMHGGSVEAQSQGIGQGARFIVRLATAESHVRKAPQKTVPTRLESPLRIIVVDDNRDGAESIGRLMELVGHDVRTLTSGAAAIACATEFRPDVVLLDIAMPGMSGYEVARRLRAMDGGADLCVIAMTGYGGEEDRRKSAENGIDHHLVKPIDFRGLESLLASVAQRRTSH